MKIFIYERDHDILETNIIIEDVNIILTAIKNKKFNAYKTSGYIKIPINGEFGIKLKHITYPFNIIFQTQVDKKGLTLDTRYYDIIIYAYMANIDDLWNNMLLFLNHHKTNLIHELHHVIDINKSKGKIVKKYVKHQDDKQEYLNQEVEFNAVFKQALSRMMENINNNLLKYEKWLKDPELSFFYKTARDFLKEFGQTLNDPKYFTNQLIKIIEHIRSGINSEDYKLNPDQRKRVITRGTAIYNKLRDTVISTYNSYKNDNFSK